MTKFANSVNAHTQGTQYISSSGIWSGVDGGASGQVLTSNGTGVAPSFQATSSGSVTIQVDASGSVSGSTLQLYATSGDGGANSGATMAFVAASGTEIDLSTTDANGNIAIGNNAFYDNGTADATYCTVVGQSAAYYGNTWSFTCAYGFQAGVCSGTSGTNTIANSSFFGADCGSGAIASTTDDSFYGYKIGPNYVGGSGLNTIVGSQSIGSLLSGTNNISIGYMSGSAWNGSESGNINLGSNGVSGDTNITRIGFLNGSHSQLGFYADGINTANSSGFTSPLPVYVDSSTGQLGYGAVNSTYNAASIIVSPTSGQGNYTTIGAALAAASSGQDILIKAGTYTENPTLVAGVNLVAFDANALTPEVTINGVCTFTGAGTVSISGIRLETNSGYALAVTGSAASIVNLENCYINASNHTGIDFTSSSSSAQVNLIKCQGNLGTTGIGLFTHSSSGSLNISYSNFTNSGSSTTANTAATGPLNINYSTISNPITTSSGCTCVLQYSQFFGGSATTLTFGSIEVARVLDCYVQSSSSAVSISSSCAAQLIGGSYSSGSIHSITGSGTLYYNNLTFSGSFSGINTTTVTNLASGEPISSANGGTGEENPVGLTISLYSGAQGFVGTSDSSGNQTWQAPTITASTTTVTTTPYNVLSTDQFLEVNTSSSAITIDLNTGPVNSTIYICDYTGNAATNNITLNGGATNINGSATYVISDNYGCVCLLYDGTEFVIYSQYNSASGGSSVSLTGDTGGALTGSSFTIYTNTAANNCGSSVSISGSGTTLTLNVTDAQGNTIIGNGGGNSTISGYNNVSLGGFTGNANLYHLTSGNGNIVVADGSGLEQLTTGSYNIVLGAGGVGSVYTSNESSNILIGTDVYGTVGESNILRIGSATGTSAGNLNAAYIQGIYNNDSSGFTSPLPVYIDSTTGQLGYGSSASSISLTGDSGGTLTGSSFTISGGSTGLTTSGSGTTLDLTGTLDVGNGGTGTATMTTAYAPVCAGTTATGALQVASTGLSTSGYVLTSNGSSNLPSFQAIPSTFASINVQTFASSGTYTPTSGMIYCIVECVGAGGGGGGVHLGWAGGGGGGGSYVRGFYTASSIGSSQTVTIGAVGSAGSTSGGDGGTGGSTLFGSLITAVGGSGGGGGNASTMTNIGGAGGTGSSGGSFQTSGTPGGYSVTTGSTATSGSGGSSFFGGGAINVFQTISGGTAGNNGTSYGGGGSGAAITASSSPAGGTGAKGFIVVTEFIS